MCGGLIQNKTGVISSRPPYVPKELLEADCLWTIQAHENQVIRYNLLIDEEIGQEQCIAAALVIFINCIIPIKSRGGGGGGGEQCIYSKGHYLESKV